MRRFQRAFTLLEMLVSTAIMTLVLLAVLSLMHMTSQSYQRTMGRLDSFEAARAAFDTMGRNLRQATLLAHVGYDSPTAPSRYTLKSDLHFFSGSQDALGLNKGLPDSHAVFFQAPLGVADSADLQKANALLISTGFFIAYGEDPLLSSLPDTIRDKLENKRRFRLYQFIQPREDMTVYENTITTLGNIPVSNVSYSARDWFSTSVNQGEHIHPLAENVIALVILPIYRGDPWTSYTWNSRIAGATHHRLPDALHVLLVAIDEKSAQRMENGTTPLVLVPSHLFRVAGSLEDDVKTLETALGAHTPALNYRIFQTVIPLSSTDISL